MDKYLCPDNQHHSENLVNTVFLGKQQTASDNVYAHIMYRNWATEIVEHLY